jgi:hypothetical protein
MDSKRVDVLQLDVEIFRIEFFQGASLAMHGEAKAAAEHFASVCI